MVAIRGTFPITDFHHVATLSWNYAGDSEEVSTGGKAIDSTGEAAIGISEKRCRSVRTVRKNKWRRLPACEFFSDRLEAYPTFQIRQ